MSDAVNHPKHYNAHPSGVEAIEMCRLLPFSIGNAVKYLMRAGLKDASSTKQDLLKAAWYLNDQASDPDFCISVKAMRIAKKIMEAEPYGTSLYCLLALLANLSWDAEELARLSAAVEREAMELKDEEKKTESYYVWNVACFTKEGRREWISHFEKASEIPSVSFSSNVAEAFPDKRYAFFFLALVREKISRGELSFSSAKVFRTRYRKKR